MSKKLFVDLKENSYNILIEKGILNRLGEEIKKIYKGKKIFIITDENVNSNYRDVVENSLNTTGFITRFMVLKPGEETKSFNTLPNIFKELLDFKLTRIRAYNNPWWRSDRRFRGLCCLHLSKGCAIYTGANHIALSSR